MPNKDDEFFYYTLMDVKSCVDEWGDVFFSELHLSFPEIYDRLEAYLANKQVQEFLSNQNEVL